MVTSSAPTDAKRCILAPLNRVSAPGGAAAGISGAAGVSGARSELMPVSSCNARAIARPPARRTPSARDAMGARRQRQTGCGWCEGDQPLHGVDLPLAAIDIDPREDLRQQPDRNQHGARL